MHVIEDQLTKEGILITFKVLFGEAVFAGSAVFMHNGAGSCNARLGTQPAILQEIPTPLDTTAHGPLRYSPRIREVAVQKIIESIAVSRRNCALRSHTTQS